MYLEFITRKKQRNNIGDDYLLSSQDECKGTAAI
jgi:hypothetical protein